MAVPRPGRIWIYFDTYREVFAIEGILNLVRSIQNAFSIDCPTAPLDEFSLQQRPSITAKRFHVE